MTDFTKAPLHKEIPLEEYKELCIFLLPKYQKLLRFVKQIKSQRCSLIDGVDCLSCRALEILREIGEEDAKK